MDSKGRENEKSEKKLRKSREMPPKEGPENDNTLVLLLVFPKLFLRAHLNTTVKILDEREKAKKTSQSTRAIKTMDGPLGLNLGHLT